MAANAPPLPRNRLVVVDEGRLSDLAANASVVREFPFLRALKAVARKPGCGQCGSSGGTAGQRAAAFGDVKRAVAGMPADKKRRLKELLDARQVRVVYAKPGGQVIHLTF